MLQSEEQDKASKKPLNDKGENLPTSVVPGNQAVPWDGDKIMLRTKTWEIVV